MMNLHKNKEEFLRVVDIVYDSTGVQRDIIEKDYYVTLILKEFFNVEEGLVFKGGTSLSKAYHLIDRFSEDIDLNFINHAALNRNKRKEIKYKLKDVVDKCGLKIINFDETKSNRDFNRYEIEYIKSYPTSISLKPNVILEMAYQEESYPCERKNVNSIIGEYLTNIKAFDVIKKYEMDSFEITVQSYLRTFIDKLFAICDYYLCNMPNNHSRHLYDVYKIYPLITFDKDFKSLFLQVKEERSQRKICLSALSERNLSDLLNDCVQLNIYKDDYNNRTASLIMDDIVYEETLDCLKEIIINLKELGL